MGKSSSKEQIANSKDYKQTSPMTKEDKKEKKKKKKKIVRTSVRNSKDYKQTSPMTKEDKKEIKKKKKKIVRTSVRYSKDYKQTSPMTKEDKKEKKKKKKKIVRTSVRPNSPKEPETHPRDTEYKGGTPRVTKDSMDPAITGHSKSSESTNGNVQTITRVTEHSIDHNDTGGNSEYYEQTIPMAKEDEKETKKEKKNTFITSVTITNSKRNETTTGGAQNHSIRPEDNICGNKDYTHFNVNTNSAGYSKRNDMTQIDQLDGGPVSHDQSDTASCSNVQTAFNSSESTNGNVQTITRVTELAIIDYNDTGGNDITEIDQLDGGLVSHDKSDTSSCSNVQTANSENYEQTIPMAKEDEKETKKKKKKEKIFSTSVMMEPSKEETSDPMKAEYRLTQEENTGGKKKMSVTEQQIKAMMMEAKRLAERCRSDIEASNANGEDLKLCPKAFIQSISSVEEYISNLILENSKLAMEKNDYLNRLSSAAGSRLTDNNPNIANLHDPNRPMKLADKFNRIYDDEWTDMIERLEKKGPNTQEHKYKCVYHLYSVLIVIFNSLSKKAEVQLQGLAEHLFLLTKPSTEEIHATWVGYKEERVQLIASRKKTAERTILKLYQTLQKDPIFIQELHECSPPLEDVMLDEIAPSEYFKKCVEICWHFVIQDPPMYVENVSLKGTKIDKDTHKVFTKSGDIVKYHAWPALYLHHQDGNNSPLMGKGVVQPE